MKNKFKYIILILLAVLLVDYFMLIPINVRYPSVLIALLFLVCLIYFIIYGGISFQTYVVNNRVRVKTVGDNKNFTRTVILIIALNVILPFISSPVFFASSYSQLIGNVSQTDFYSDFDNPNLDELPIVDNEYARVLGDKKLGSISGLGSEFHVGQYTDIIYNGAFYSVAPLEYNDIFKWINNRSTGAPGYILINKSSAEVEFVTEVNGKQLEMRYIESAYFNQDLKRQAYFSGGWNNQLLDPFFELDEAGNPFFVYPKTKKTIGWSGGDDVYQVIVVNAVTGDTELYDVGEQPAWIDNVYPVQLVDQQLNYYGKYNEGFLNSLFSQEGLLQTTVGQRHIDNQGELFTYTGMTSIGSDESTVGMAFVDVSNKKTTVYSLTGATETAAMSSAEGKVQNLQYTATFPIPVNINGEGAYFISLKDKSGLIKQYAFVNINNYSIVENDSTISNAYLKYVDTMGYNDIGDLSSIDSMEGTVVRISSEIVDGNTQYIIIIEIDGENYLYIANQISDELAITTEGDLVSIKVSNDKLIDFDNLTIEYKEE